MMNEIIFEVIDTKYRKHPNINILLPRRSTSHSAGYDFFSPENILIYPGLSVILWTDIRVRLPSNMFLMTSIRSSLAKKGLILSNGIGIIDSDYYLNKNNNGNIAFLIHNIGEKMEKININDKVAQGVILKYNITATDNTNTIRKGGIGSTDDKPSEIMLEKL